MKTDTKSGDNRTVERTIKEMAGTLREAAEEEQTAILQKIGGVLIGGCNIRIFDMEIRPLWVEAYYFHETRFPDDNTHRSGKQKNRFGQLYLHEKGYGGVDICLSDGEDFYLSFLLKATLADGAFLKQKGLADRLKKMGKTKAELEGLEHILVDADRECRVGYAARVHLVRPCYRKARLAVYAADALGEYDLSFARESLRENVREYMKDFIAAYPDRTAREYKDECRRAFGWAPASVLEPLLKGRP